MTIFFRSFGIFSLFWYVVRRKIWQPWCLTEGEKEGLGYLYSLQVSMLSQSKSLRTRNQGCQMVVFQTKNANFDIFWKALVWIFLGELHVHSEFLLLFWYILWQSCTYVCGHFGHFPQFFFFLHQEKSGNLARNVTREAFKALRNDVENRVADFQIVKHSSLMSPPVG
jgi:hypothetical protein